ncbi:MAG: hypothetical protein O4805_05285, partial [Trichodesmium sp. St16_bin2-tuft]|nr:hypothetical protein [Trichodesmium sp. St16_bin2-tuft]
SLFDKGFSNRTLYKYQHLWAPMMVKNEEEGVIVDIPESESNSYQEICNVEEAETLTEKLLPTPPPNNESICFLRDLGEGQDLNAVSKPKDLKTSKTRNQKTNFINKFIQQVFKSGVKTKIVLQIFRIFCKFLLQYLESSLTKAVGQVLDINKDTSGKDTIGREEISPQVINSQQSIVLENLDSHSSAGREEISPQVINGQQSIVPETLNSDLDDDGWPILVTSDLDDDGWPILVGSDVDEDEYEYEDGDRPSNCNVNEDDNDDDDDDDDDNIIVGELAITQINIDSDILTASVNNDHIGSDVIDDNPSDDINDDDSSLNGAAYNFDIVPPDINTFNNNASSVSDIDNYDTDSSDSDDIDEYVFDVSIVDSNERSNVFNDSEDIGDSDCNDIVDDGIHATDIYSDSIKDDNEISYIDSIDSDELDDIINSTYHNVNTTKSYRNNYHPFRYVVPTMTIKQIKSMYPKSKWLEAAEHFGYSADDLVN